MSEFTAISLPIQRNWRVLTAAALDTLQISYLRTPNGLAVSRDSMVAAFLNTPEHNVYSNVMDLLRLDTGLDPAQLRWSAKDDDFYYISFTVN